MNGKKDDLSIIQNRKNQKESSPNEKNHQEKPKSKSKALRDYFSDERKIILQVVLRPIVRK